MTPEPSPSLHSLAEPVLRCLTDYLESSRTGDSSVIRDRPLPEVDADLDWARWLPEGGMDEAALRDFIERYLGWTTRLHHPHFLAHQVAAPDEFSSIADLVNGVLNNGMAVYEMGPPAVALERAVIEWLLSKVGWSVTVGGSFGSGVLTHGGSLANLTALLAARARIAPNAWEDGTPKDLVILAPTNCHYSLSRAAGILGLGTKSVVALPANELGVVRADEFLSTLDAVQQSGKRVMAVVLNACATATGLHDPIGPIAKLCRERGVWCHVDAAHGGSALVSPRLKTRLEGVENADSLVWDAHKMLRVSVLCAAVLFREPQSALSAFQQDASYFAKTDPDRENLFEKAVECTKTGLGLKLYLVLARHGEAQLGAHVEALYDRTQEYYEYLRQESNFECPYVPETNILCFRVPGHDQEAIRRQLIDEGSYYLTATRIGSELYLRMTVMNPRSDRKVIEGLVSRIRELTTVTP